MRLAESGVSRREAEVLDALGERLTNAQIAARLHVSVRTVEGHVSSLLRKLDADDRTRLAELADEIDGSRPSLASRPAPLTPLVGRVEERAALAAVLRDERLVTAVGPGGVGKTRLAIAVADDVADRYPDGVWYVNLIPVTQSARIPLALAEVLRPGQSTDWPAEDAVVAALACRNALVVLDNCEHLVDAVARFVEHLLACCAHVSVLATSRARMRVPHERVFPVPGLSLPPAPCDETLAGPRDVTWAVLGDGPHHVDAGDAVALFAARAASAGRPVTNPVELMCVQKLCRAMDGNALAIELAAARLPTLGLDGLEAGLSDQLRLLTGGTRRDRRHRSLRATLELSYRLADPVDQAVLRRLAVFAAPFTLDAAAVVAGFPPVDEGEEAGIVADAVGRLAEQSLVVALHGNGVTSYRLLEMVRQYGRDRLEIEREVACVHERHLRHCCDTATTMLAEPPDDAWNEGFDLVADDLRAALRWTRAQTGRREQAQELAESLALLTFRRGLAEEAQEYFQDAAALSDDATQSRD